MTDMAEEAGLRVPHLTDKTVKAIEEFVPIQGSSAKNPLDIMGAFFDRGYENLQLLMDLLREDPNIDALIFNQPVDLIARVVGSSMISLLPQLIRESMDRMGKPIFVVLDKGRGASNARSSGRSWKTDITMPVWPPSPPSHRRLGLWPSWFGIDGTWRRSGGRPRTTRKNIMDKRTVPSLSGRRPHFFCRVTKGLVYHANQQPIKGLKIVSTNGDRGG